MITTNKDGIFFELNGIQYKIIMSFSNSKDANDFMNANKNSGVIGVYRDLILITDIRE